MKRRSKPEGGRKRVKVKRVYGFINSMSKETSIRDSKIGNMNKIFMNEATVVTNRCNVLGIKFRELVGVVIREISEATEEN